MASRERSLRRCRDSRSDRRRSMVSAVHVSSRTSLRPSSTREPSGPPSEALTRGCLPCFCMSRSPDLCYRCAPLECSLLSQRVLLAMPDGSLRVTGTRDLERGFPCLVCSFHFDLVQARTLLAFKSASRLCIVAAGLTQLRYFERCSHSRSAKLCSLAACLLHRFSRFVT